MKSFSKRSIFIPIILFLVLISGGLVDFVTNFYTNLLWFKNLDFSGVFWTTFKAKILVQVIIWFLFAIFIYINLLFTKKTVLKFIDNLKASKADEEEQIIELNPQHSDGIGDWITSKKLNWIYLLLSLAIALFFSNISTTAWKDFLKFINATSFDSVDPLFNKDISFYVFKLSFYQLVYTLLSIMLVVTALIIGAINFFFNSGRTILSRLKKGKYHLSFLISIFFLLKAWGYRLDMYKLLYSQRGVAFGASYTDVNASLFGLKILSIIAIVLAIFIFINIFVKNTKYIIFGIITLFVASLVLNIAYPAIVQQYQVEPNEIAKESKYIEYNIKYTQEAYNLDKIEQRSFNVSENLSYDDIKNNQATIENIRLWDHRPLQTTYGQVQGIRSYYDFNDIDVDRYKIDGEVKQVMLGSRELNQKLLNKRAQTWVNQRLLYTHGFGLAMSPVSKVTPGGLPEFLIKDVPPKSDQFTLNQPRIYYGELTDEYVIVNTKAKEFDYPQGDQNNYVNYQGNGGIKLNSLMRKLAFSYKYKTLKLLLNNDITDQSRLMFTRNIKDRVNKVAPFLQYDSDPYLVIADEGDLYWIHDAYTTTNLYPYSEPYKWGNYIRNSIKVVTNAYTGKMKFYIVDETDPLAKTYQKIFPELFTEFSEMPEDIKAHLRYPQDLFKVQANLYSNYHMENPTVFYNKEDLWNIPQENYDGESIEMQPYYMLIQLPEEDEEEKDFLLMLPFTPVKKDNMIAWLAAKSDPEEYGELVLYKFPKRKLVYGPMQIESRIDQNSDISQQLSLWNQRGSRVIRGNLLTIPIKNSILYVEPIYLQAEQSQLPELKRVIVSYGEEIIMANNLDLALKELFNIKDLPPEAQDKIEQEEDTTPIDYDNLTLQQLTTELTRLYNDSQEALKEGNWSEYGKIIEEFEIKLKLLEEKSK